MKHLNNFFYIYLDRFQFTNMYRHFYIFTEYMSVKFEG